MLSAEECAWEFLKLNPSYRRESAAEGHKIEIQHEGPTFRIVRVPFNAAERWGLVYYENTDRVTRGPVPVWSGSIHPGVLPVRALALRREQARDLVDFRELNVPVLIVRDGAHEHIVLCGNGRTLRLHVYDGTVLNGPVRLSFRVEGLSGAEDKVQTLNRFLAFLRKGIVPPASRLTPRTAKRLLLALDVYPFVQAGRSDKEIAAELYRNHDVRHWTAENAWIRAQIRRARKQGQYLVGGGYRTLLSPENSDQIPDF